MAANALRLRRSLALTSSISKHFSSVLPSVAPISSPSTIQQNPSTFDVNQSKPRSLSSQFISSRAISSRARYVNDGTDGDQISPDAVLFEGCDYNHWLITMDFPKDPKPSPEEMVETYVQTAAKVLGSVEEAKKKIYACSTTTYNGFQVEVSEEVSEQFKGIPGVVFVLPDSYIDPVNKEYGGDKYINGTIIPRPPPVQYGRQGGRYNDRNREYNRPSRVQMDQNGPPGGQGIYQGDRRGPMPPYQSNYNQGDGRNVNPSRQTDFPQRDQGNFITPPPPVGGYNQGGGGGSYRQGSEGQYGQGGGSGGGYGGQYGQPGGGNYRQGAGGSGGQYGQGGGGGGGQYGQGGGQYSQGGGGVGQYGQGGGGGGQYGQGGGGGSMQGGGGGQYGQGGGGNYGQGVGGGFGQGVGSGSSQSSSQYGGNSRFSQTDQRRDVSGQQGNYEEAEAFNER